MGTPRTLNRKQVIDVLGKGGDLSDADLRGCDLAAISFDGANLQRAKLAEAILTGSSFRGADLSRASLWQADCQDCIFDDAILEETDLDFAYLDGCSFRGARVRKAIFPFTHLSLDDIKQSVKTGRRVRMERVPADD